MLGHELRAPLAPIVSAVQILRLQDNEGLVERQACMIIERQVGQIKHLVDLHGGTVDATSTRGQGSEFVVRLPMTTPPDAPTLPIARVKKVDQGCRVLVVDDSVDTTHSLALLLAASGHTVRTAHDGPAALAALADEAAEVVLMDIGLPGIDGYEVARRIRRLPAADRMVLVAMTGYGQERDRQLAREAGFDHHLVKPADFADVLGILAAATDSLVPDR